MRVLSKFKSRYGKQRPVDYGRRKFIIARNKSIHKCLSE